MSFMDTFLKLENKDCHIYSKQLKDDWIKLGGPHTWERICENETHELWVDTGYGYLLLFRKDFSWSEMAKDFLYDEEKGICALSSYYLGDKELIFKIDIKEK